MHPTRTRLANNDVRCENCLATVLSKEWSEGAERRCAFARAGPVQYPLEGSNRFGGVGGISPDQRDGVW